MMWFGKTALCSFVCIILSGCGGKPAAETKIPQEEVDRKNPIDSNPMSIAEGKLLYSATDCALCHGIDGGGKGVLAKDVNMNTHDWRKAGYLEKFTDGELLYLILKGKGRMPAYDNRQTATQAWQMVTYIRSLPIAGQ